MQNRIITLNSKSTPWNISLIHLNLAGNELTAIDGSAFHGLKTLKTLDLSGNLKLQVIENNTFVDFQFLSELDLSNTRIFELPVHRLPFLATLILESSYCPPSLIRPGNLGDEAPSLTTLNLINTELVRESYGIHPTTNLLSLVCKTYRDLNFQVIHWFPSHWASSRIYRIYKFYVWMKCSLVALEIGIFKDLKSLVLLSLKDNHLRVISTGLFDELYDLKYLLLSGNELTYLDSNLFKYLSGLVLLDASRNRISGLNRSTFEPLARLTTLDLSLNPLVCNCDLKWLPGWLEGTVELIDSMDTTCLDNAVTLEPFRGKQLITFDPRDECGPNIILYSCLAMLGMVLIFALGLIYYQRWWIRYRLFLLKLCFIGYEEIHDDVDRGEFQYDIAIMLDEADDMWVNQHLRPALMERVPDFNRIVCGDEELMLGMYYLDAVHYATEKSFKTIIVISHAALQDQWFMMKFRTVLDHVNDIGTEKMILVFVEDVVDDELPFLIRLFLSDHRPYLVWPDDERGRDYFWEELIRDLKVNLRCNHLIPPN